MCKQFKLKYKLVLCTFIVKNTFVKYLKSKNNILGYINLFFHRPLKWSDSASSQVPIATLDQGLEDDFQLLPGK